MADIERGNALAPPQALLLYVPLVQAVAEAGRGDECAAAAVECEFDCSECDGSDDVVVEGGVGFMSTGGGDDPGSTDDITDEGKALARLGRAMRDGHVEGRRRRKVSFGVGTTEAGGERKMEDLEAEPTKFESKRKEEEDGEPEDVPKWVCPQCGILVHIRLQACPACGFRLVSGGSGEGKEESEHGKTEGGMEMTEVGGETIEAGGETTEVGGEQKSDDEVTGRLKGQSSLSRTTDRKALEFVRRTHQRLGHRSVEKLKVQLKSGTFRGSSIPFIDDDQCVNPA